MSPLATEIYKLLLRALRANHASITYGELAARLARKHSTHPRSPKLHAALGEVTRACREHDLPCLPAIVWASATLRPSDGYYKVAHPLSRSDKSARAAWEREHARVLSEASRFPASL